MSEDFSRECLKVVVALTCQDKGFTRAKESALNTFADVLQRYIEEIGYRSHRLAEHSGRSESKLADVTLSLSEMGLSISDLSEIPQKSNPLPFPKNIIPFPVPREHKQPKKSKTPTEPKPPYIPDFLPPFPDKHTYIKTNEKLDQSTEIKDTQPTILDESAMEIDFDTASHLNSSFTTEHALSNGS
eukprot:TRINITY_DN1924_c0_g1_i1.p1 TRINITY_DN1924_c0_g1~~TRINITY_DN1924_c0_g1_i1.p1  ORF type:complete len:186 (+),score=27.15 TRINITY_DN1924_c0_g1_i1:57-614(+)